MKNLVLFCAGVFVFFFVLILRVYIIVDYWDWFIINFFNVNSLTIPLALGFSGMLAIFSPNLSATKNKYNSGYFEQMGNAIIVYLSLWLMGWIVFEFFLEQTIIIGF